MASAGVTLQLLVACLVSFAVEATDEFTEGAKGVKVIQ